MSDQKPISYIPPGDSPSPRSKPVWAGYVNYSLVAVGLGLLATSQMKPPPGWVILCALVMAGRCLWTERRKRAWWWRVLTLVGYWLLFGLSILPGLLILAPIAAVGIYVFGWGANQPGWLDGMATWAGSLIILVPLMRRSHLYSGTHESAAALPSKAPPPAMDTDPIAVPDAALTEWDS